MTIQIDFLSFHAWCDMTTYHDVFANFGKGWRWHSGPHRTNEMAAAHFRMLCVIAAVRRGWLQVSKRGTSLPAAGGRRIQPKWLRRFSIGIAEDRPSFGPAVHFETPAKALK
jgi:hypothetical protein